MQLHISMTVLSEFSNLIVFRVYDLWYIILCMVYITEFTSSLKYLFITSCEEDILNGIQFLLSEENLQKLVVEEEHKDEAVEELTREEKADLEVCESSVVPEETICAVTEADVPEEEEEEGTSGGYFDLLPVSGDHWRSFFMLCW